jgi:hypothetical protein
MTNHDPVEPWRNESRRLARLWGKQSPQRGPGEPMTFLHFVVGDLQNQIDELRAYKQTPFEVQARDLDTGDWITLVRFAPGTLSQSEAANNLVAVLLRSGLSARRVETEMNA